MTITNSHEVDAVCASCGISGVDDIKLKKCNGCKLVRYCSAACQKDHWPQHKRPCKKRAAELREELLFKQPEQSYLGDCPICFLPIPIDPSKTGYSYHACCSKLVCDGCIYANLLYENEESLDHKCPFCRTPSPESIEKNSQYNARRMSANDPVAIFLRGKKHYDEKNFSSALELFTKAAELGDIDAHYSLADFYMNGEGVERDEKKGLYHFEEAAICGHPQARYNLGVVENNRFRIDKAVKHWFIAANLGHDLSMEALKKIYPKGFVKKEDLAASLRAHKAAVDATKSPQREAADRFFTETKSTDRAR